MLADAVDDDDDSASAAAIISYRVEISIYFEFHL